MLQLPKGNGKCFSKVWCGSSQLLWHGFGCVSHGDVQGGIFSSLCCTLCNYVDILSKHLCPLGFPEGCNFTLNHRCQLRLAICTSLDVLMDLVTSPFLHILEPVKVGDFTGSYSSKEQFYFEQL